MPPASSWVHLAVAGGPPVGDPEGCCRRPAIRGIARKVSATIDVKDSRAKEGQLFGMFKGPFKVSSGIVEWHRSSYGTAFDSFEVGSPAVSRADIDLYVRIIAVCLPPTSVSTGST